MGLGDNIKRLRESGGHTNAAQFARKIGKSPGTLGDWEAGKYKRLRLDSLLKIAKAIPCSIEDLLVGVDAEYDAIQEQRAVPAHDTVKEEIRTSSRETPDAVGASDQPSSLTDIQSVGDTSEHVTGRIDGTIVGGKPQASPDRRQLPTSPKELAARLIELAIVLDELNVRAALRAAGVALLGGKDPNAQTDTPSRRKRGRGRGGRAPKERSDDT